jgi:hypothetical protein
MTKLKFTQLLDLDGVPIIAGQGYVLVVTRIPGKVGEEVDDEVIKSVLQRKNTVRRLQGNGDFRSVECIQYLKECDICCTNPPFSLFAELFSLLVKYDKQYLLIVIRMLSLIRKFSLTLRKTRHGSATDLVIRLQ